MAKYVYFNYPNPEISIHNDPEYPDIQKHGKHDQREINISRSNLGTVLNEFIQRNVPFDAKAEKNDLWLVIDLGTDEQETGVVHVIQAILSERYAPFGRITVKKRCG